MLLSHIGEYACKYCEFESFEIHSKFAQKLRLFLPRSSLHLSLGIYFKCTANACQRLSMPYKCLAIVANGASGPKNNIY